LKKPSKGYRWVEQLLTHPVDDGRHRLLWLVIAPYLVNIEKLNPEIAKQKALEYLRICNEKRPINGDLTRLVNYHVEYAYEKALKPPSLRTLKTKHPDLYEILQRKSNRNG